MQMRKCITNLVVTDLSNYKSAVIALKNAQIDFPDIKYAEEMNLLIVKSQFEYAKASYEFRQEERFTEAITYADEFLENYPESKLTEEVLALKKDSEKGIANAKQVLATQEEQVAKYKANLQKEAQKDSINKVIKTPIK